jgi:xylulokinase/toxin CptA
VQLDEATQTVPDTERANAYEVIYQRYRYQLSALHSETLGAL